MELISFHYDLLIYKKEGLEASFLKDKSYNDCVSAKQIFHHYCFHAARRSDLA